MNERIKQLAKQARQIGEYVNYGQIRLSPGQFEQKFAELIVKECANKLRETDYELVFVEDGMCDPSISDAMLVAASDIEEHFGVE